VAPSHADPNGLLPNWPSLIETTRAFSFASASTLRGQHSAAFLPAYFLRFSVVTALPRTVQEHVR